MMIDIRQPGWVGCAFAQCRLFCKVGFVSSSCVPCNVLKVASGKLLMHGFITQLKLAGMGSSTALPLRAYCRQPEY